MEVFDIVFVDVPCIAADMNECLAGEVTLYRKESEAIINQITNKPFREKPLQYTSGILCLSSYLKQRIPNIRVGYIHQELNIVELERYAKKAKVVAFSTMTFLMPRIIQLISIVKAANPKAHIILGGYHATYFPKELLEEYAFIDCIILKEGEKALLQYMRGIPFDQIRGFAYRDAEGIIHINNECDWLNANDIPLPDYSLIKENIQLFNISLTTMRGCIGQCRFCANNDYWSHPRLIPIDKIIRELKYLKSVLEPGCVIHINDNVFTYQLDRIKKLYTMMRDAGLTDYFVFECDTLANLISKPIVHLLSKMGVHKICLGFEDCCDTVLRMSNKPVSFEQNLAAARIIKQEVPEICVYAYWLIGLPGSTVDTMEDNLNAMHELIVTRTVDIISPKVFIPYPGSVFYNNYTEYGIKELDYDWAKYERRNPPYPYMYDRLSEKDIFSYLLASLRTCHKAYQQIRCPINFNELPVTDDLCGQHG